MAFIVPFSPTPTFTWDRGDPHAFTIILTGDVTSSVFDQTIAAPRGTEFCFIVVQDAVGGHAFAWPSICRGAPVIGAIAGQTTLQKFILLDGPILMAHVPPTFV